MGPLLIDDAYIYFRYALNAASGKGLVYNPGQLVFGVTSPSYMGLLTLLAVGGLDLPHAATYLGIALDLMSSLGLLTLGRRLRSDTVGWLAALFFALAPKAVIPGLSGMETSLFTVLIILCLICLVEEQTLAAMLLAGVAGATRPEGLALIAVIAAYLALNQRRSLPKGVLIGVTPFLTWLVISRIIFHTWVPNSIVAKATVYPAYTNRLHDALLILRYLTNPFEFTASTPGFGLTNVIMAILGLYGLADLVGRSRAVAYFALWSAMIAAAYALVNRFMFPWYLGPFFPLSSLAIADGVDRALQSQRVKAALLRLFPHTERALKASLTAILALTCIAASVLVGVYVRRDQEHREIAYLRLGEWLSSHLPSDDVVASVEIGAISYGYGGPVLDLTGLVSPQVLPFYSDPTFVFRYPHTLPPKAVEQLAPPVLVTYDKFIADYSDASWFKRAYPNVRVIETGHPVYGTLMVFTAQGVPIPPS
jgi:hypothetical protein